MATSGWARYPRNRTAFRGYGQGALVLVKAVNGWRVFDSEKNELPLAAADEQDLETVIELVDLQHPPANWTRLDQSAWERGDWKVLSTATGWKIQHPKFSTRQSFRSADRARKWIDLRAQREDSVRGPRCRAGTRATRVLPDVRVTEAERADALNLAAELNLSFAELVRAALKTARAAWASDALMYDRAENALVLSRPGCTCAAREV